MARLWLNRHWLPRGACSLLPSPAVLLRIAATEGWYLPAVGSLGILSRRHLCGRLLRLVWSTGVNKIGSEAGLVSPLTLLRSDELCLLLLRAELRLCVAWLSRTRRSVAHLRAGLTRSAWRGNASRPISRGGSLLRRRPRRECGIAARSSGGCRLQLVLVLLGLELVFQVLHVVVRVVLEHRLRRLALRCRLLRWSLLAGRTEERGPRLPATPCQVHEGLEVLLQDTLRLVLRAVQLRLDLRPGLRFQCGE